MTSHLFCRELSLARGEPLAGTGETSERYLLLRWPRGKWRLPRFESVGMSADLGAAVQAAMKSRVHVALIDRVGDGASLPLLQADGIAADFDDEASLIRAIDGFVAGEPLKGRRDDRIVVLCCTDSRRDACCARYGFTAYKALVEVADPSRFHIVQATHVGGCRFAASLVVLPQRQRYGRIGPEHAATFLASLDRGEICLPFYRGRPGLPEPAQVAEIAAMQWAQANGYAQSAVRIGPAPPAMALGGKPLTIEAAVGDARLALDLVTTPYEVHTRCTAIHTEPAEIVPRWRVAGIETIAAGQNRAPTGR